MKICPYFFSIKSIPVEEATIEELKSCKRNCKINLAIWSIGLCVFVMILSKSSILSFDWFIGFFWCAFIIIQLWYSNKMLKTVKEALKLKNNF